MIAISAFFALALASSPHYAKPDDDRPKKRFESEHYAVTWGTVPTFTADAELEIGDGLGHGGTLGWLRFKPGKDGVDVLSIKLDEGWNPYRSKHQPDLAPVTIKRALLKVDTYAELLKDLAVVDSAKLNSPTTGGGHSTSDFWVSARLTGDKKTLLDLDWAGYAADRNEIKYAKSQAAVTLAQKVVEKLDFKEHNLTGADRAWASAKFARDWKRYKESLDHSWVRARSIVVIGVVGDAAAFPTLREILAENKEFVYYTINAVTRLKGKDVRDKPVEEMDVEKIRPKVLELIKENK